MTELEGGKIDPKARLDLLRNIEEGLKKERKDFKKRKEDEELAKRLEEEKKNIEEVKAEQLNINIDTVEQTKVKNLKVFFFKVLYLYHSFRNLKKLKHKKILLSLRLYQNLKS